MGICSNQGQAPDLRHKQVFHTRSSIKSFILSAAAEELPILVLSVQFDDILD